MRHLLFYFIVEEDIESGGKLMNVFSGVVLENDGKDIQSLCFGVVFLTKRKDLVIF